MAVEPQPYSNCRILFGGMWRYFYTKGAVGAARSRATALERIGITVLALDMPQRIVFWHGSESANNKFVLSKISDFDTGCSHLTLGRGGVTWYVDRDFMSWPDMLSYVFRLARIPYPHVTTNQVRA